MELRLHHLKRLDRTVLFQDDSFGASLAHLALPFSPRSPMLQSYRDGAALAEAIGSYQSIPFDFAK